MLRSVVTASRSCVKELGTRAASSYLSGNVTRRVVALLPRLLGAATTGVLVVLAFPRYGFEVGLDGLIAVALVPLIVASVGVGWRRGLLLGACAGLIIEAAGFSWILFAIESFTGMPAPLPSMLFGGWLLYASIPWCLLGVVLGRCERDADVYWVVPFWVGLEHAFPRLFPWHLGGALYGRLGIVQGVDLIGASGLTLIVLLANITVALSICRSRREWRAGLARWAVCLAVLGAWLAYGAFRLPEVESELERDLRQKNSAPMSVLLVQGALDPALRNEKGLLIYSSRTRSALGDGPLPDLVVWPEGAANVIFHAEPGREILFAENRFGWAITALRNVKAPLVTGAAAYRDGYVTCSNAAVFLSPGQKPIVYEKNRRLLFGEYVPLIDYLPADLRRSALQHIGTIPAGTTNPVCRCGQATFRNLICYEGVLPDYVRRSADGVDFLVNVTEDIWYGQTSHTGQHVSVLILRAVENRISIARAANMGPSGVIDLTGTFHASPSSFAADVVKAPLRAVHLPTTYGAGGWLAPWCALALSAVRELRRWRRARSH